MVSLTVTQKDCPETESAVHKSHGKWITCCCISRRLIQYTRAQKLMLPSGSNVDADVCSSPATIKDIYSSCLFG